MWLFREHRGGLKEAMKTCKLYDSLIDVIKEASKHSVYKKGDIREIQIYFYCDCDERIGWAPVYIVCNKNEVIGFCTEKKI